MNFTPDVTFGLQTNLKNRIRHLDITTSLSPLHLFQSLAQQSSISTFLQNPRDVLSCIAKTFEQPTSRSTKRR